MAAPAITGRAQLEVVHGPAGFQGKTFPLNCVQPATLGRDPAADLRIPSERVSRRHCQIKASREGYVLVDLGSSNGTLLNQSRIQGTHPLQPGDYIQTGDCLFRFNPA
jgi:pSer/pThr/pTyr-binding forkhead associated (FHA) protein